MHRRCISNPLPGCKHRAYGAAQHLPCPSVVVPTRLHPRPSPVSVTTPSVGTAQTTQAPSQTNGAPKEPASQPVSAAAVQGPPSPQPAAPPPPPAPSVATNSEPPPPITTQSGFQLKAIHVVMFSLIFVGGAVFATLTLQLTVGMEFSTAISTVLRRVAKSVAFRQLVVISLAILVLRYGMNNFLMTLSKFSSSPVQWDKTKLYYILKEVRADQVPGFTFWWAHTQACQHGSSTADSPGPQLLPTAHRVCPVCAYAGVPAYGASPVHRSTLHGGRRVCALAHRGAQGHSAARRQEHPFNQLHPRLCQRGVQPEVQILQGECLAGA